jgi:hypothetical protein
MRSKCEEEGVELFWGLQLMVILVEKGRLTKEAAIKAGEKISGSNARITAKNLKEFINKINAVKI